MRRLIEVLVLPPSSAILLLLSGALLRRRWPRLGLTLQLTGIFWLWLASTPAFAGVLLGTLQPYPALPLQGPLPAAEAIVILSAEAYRGGLEYGGPVAGPMTMQRVRYGAHLQRRTGLPVLVAGGRPATGAPSMGQLMADALRDEHSVPVRWIEGDSKDTWENARFAAAMLQRDGVRRVLLVTSAWHLPRAVDCFERNGITAVPAPTGFRGGIYEDAQSLMPSWQAIRDTCYAMHEWFGRAYYATLR